MHESATWPQPLRRPLVRNYRRAEPATIQWGPRVVISQRPGARITLGWSHWWIACAAILSAVVLTAHFTLSPAYFAHDCEYQYLPSMERRLGFKGARTQAEVCPQCYFLAEVRPDGILGRAGFVTGDAPIEHHGGLSNFCGAVQRAQGPLPATRERLRSQEVNVVNVLDPGLREPRRMTVPAAPP